MNLMHFQRRTGGGIAPFHTRFIQRQTMVFRIWNRNHNKVVLPGGCILHFQSIKLVDLCIRFFIIKTVIVSIFVLHCCACSILQLHPLDGGCIVCFRRLNLKQIREGGWGESIAVGCCKCQISTIEQFKFAFCSFSNFCIISPVTILAINQGDLCSSWQFRCTCIHVFLVIAQQIAACLHVALPVIGSRISCIAGIAVVMEGQVTSDVLTLRSQSMVLGVLVEVIRFVEHRAAGHGCHEVHLEHTPNNHRDVEYEFCACGRFCHRHCDQGERILLVVILGGGCEFACCCMVNQSRGILCFIGFAELFRILIVKISINDNFYLIACTNRIKTAVCRSVQILLQHRSIAVNQDHGEIGFNVIVLMSIVGGSNAFGKLRFCHPGSSQILIIRILIIYGTDNNSRLYGIAMQIIRNSRNCL